MKSSMRWLWRMSGMVLAAGLLLGCVEKTAKSSQADKVGNTEKETRAEAKAEDSAEAQPNQAALDKEPIKKLPPAPKQTSPGVDEIIKLAESGVGESVILAYIENSPIAYNLSVEEILYLYDVGISVPVMTAMIHHGNTLRGQEAKLAAKEADLEETVAKVKESLAEEAKAQAATTPTPVLQPQVGQTTGATAPASVTTAHPPAPEYATEQQPVYQPAPEVNVPQQVNYFYSSLSPYGSWYELPGYGWCWQPRTIVISPGWRPYCQGGRWIWSDHGWYWQSDYSWGWAAFHYGRWYDHPSSGWVWFPDRTWAPAWVTWRYNDSYCGWAPLPPGSHFGRSGLIYGSAAVGVGFDFGLGSVHFNFVSYKHFRERDPSRHLLVGAQSQTVYSQSKVINNIIVGNNNTIINNGIGVERVAAVSREEIRKVTIRDLPAKPVSGAPTMKPDRVEKEGSSLVVYRQPLPTQPPAPKAGLVAVRPQQELRKTSSPALQPAVQGTSPARTEAQGRGTPLTAGKVPSSVIVSPAVVPQSITLRNVTPPSVVASPAVAKPAGKQPEERQLLTTGSSRGQSPVQARAEAVKPNAPPPVHTTPEIAKTGVGVTPGSKPVSEPVYRPQPQSAPAQRQSTTPPINKPISERGVYSQGRPSPVNTTPQPVIVAPNSSRGVGLQTPSQPIAQSQPHIVTQPSRYEPPKPMASQPVYQPRAVTPNYTPQQPNYATPARPQYNAPAQAAARPAPVQTPRYETPRVAPSYSPPARPQYSAPAQPAYRPAPVQAPAPRYEAPRVAPSYSPSPAPASRPSAPAAAPAPSYRRNNEKK